MEDNQIAAVSGRCHDFEGDLPVVVTEKQKSIRLVLRSWRRWNSEVVAGMRNHVPDLSLSDAMFRRRPREPDHDRPVASISILSDEMCESVAAMVSFLDTTMLRHGRDSCLSRPTG